MATGKFPAPPMPQFVSPSFPNKKHYTGEYSDLLNYIQEFTRCGFYDYQVDIIKALAKIGGTIDK